MRYIQFPTTDDLLLCPWRRFRSRNWCVCPYCCCRSPCHLRCPADCWPTVPSVLSPLSPPASPSATKTNRYTHADTDRQTGGSKGKNKKWGSGEKGLRATPASLISYQRVRQSVTKFPSHTHVQFIIGGGKNSIKRNSGTRDVSWLLSRNFVYLGETTKLWCFNYKIEGGWKTGDWIKENGGGL